MVEGSVVRYLLWGNEIAEWNRKADTLMVDDCGWQTMLTQSRLNNILHHINMAVYSERGKLYLNDLKTQKAYVWGGMHTIHLDTRRVVPARLKVENEKISEALRRFYEKARRLMDRRKMLVTATLEGAIYAFVDRWSSRIQRHALVFRVYSKGFKAYRGMVATSTICSAYVKGDAARLLNKLEKEGYEVEDPGEILSELKHLGVHISDLPESVISELAITKLMGG